MGRALLALVLMLSAAPGLAARDALGALDSCLQQLDPKLDVGYAKIAARCPDLGPSLAASPWGAWLPSDWNKPDNNLSARGLRELRALIVRESRRSAGRGQPQLERLAPLLAALHEYSAAEHRGWWARFKDWLRDVLTRPSAATDNDWLRRLFARFSVPEGTLEEVRVGALVLLALLTGAIVFAELRAAGLFGRRRAVSGGAAPRSAARPREWADIEAAELREQPRLLLELIAARLVAQQRLPPARAFTLRELLGAARLPRADDYQRLAELAQASERVRFSDRVLSPQTLTVALRRGRELLAGLEGVPR
jgi:hypothetical protein